VGESTIRVLILTKSFLQTQLKKEGKVVAGKNSTVASNKEKQGACNLLLTILLSISIVSSSSSSRKR
jgi:ribosomal protein S8E